MTSAKAKSVSLASRLLVIERSLSRSSTINNFLKLGWKTASIKPHDLCVVVEFIRMNGTRLLNSSIVVELRQ